MGTTLESRSVAFLAAGEGTEQAELQKPWQEVLAQGARPVLVSPADGKIQMFEHLDRGDTMPVDVGVVRGRTLTSLPSLQTDLRNAGATWVDEEVAVCESDLSTLVTSRKPQDLPAFCDTFTKVFAGAKA